MNNSILIQDKHDDPQTVKLSITENREWKGNNSVHFKTVISSIDNLPPLLKTTNFYHLTLNISHGPLRTSHLGLCPKGLRVSPGHLLIYMKTYN